MTGDVIVLQESCLFFYFNLRELCSLREIFALSLNAVEYILYPDSIVYFAWCKTAIVHIIFYVSFNWNELILSGNGRNACNNNRGIPYLGMALHVRAETTLIGREVTFQCKRGVTKMEHFLYIS